MKQITRQLDKTKRQQWRDEHKNGMKDCHPVVRKLAFLLYSQDKSIVDVFKQAKVAPCMLHHWTAGRSNPQIPTITRVLDVLGLELTIQHKKKG